LPIIYEINLKKINKKNDISSFLFIITKMTSECVICYNDIVNEHNNCNICNNCICNTCYIKLVQRKKRQTLSHKCPFCKNENFKEWIDIDKPVIIDYFIKYEDLMVKKILKLEEIIKSNDKYIKDLKTHIKSKNKELEINKELLEEQTNIINSMLLSFPKPIEIKKKMKYKRFYKITYWGLRESEIDITPQEAMKRVSILWKEYKKSFE
jgi:hypothetical protein